MPPTVVQPLKHAVFKTSPNMAGYGFTNPLVISQGLAEAGVDQDGYLWSAERVRQAIESTTAFKRVYTIPAGSNTVVITGAALPFTPSGLILSMGKPLSTDPDLLVGNYYELTADGFKVRLSSAPTKSGYNITAEYIP
jgi:hypothetical protein